MKTLREIGIVIAIAIAIFVLLRVSLQGYTVRYSCMLPNIENGEWIMVSKAAYWFAEPERGEVVVFEPPTSSQFPYIKRIIALPGETVEVKDDQVFINGVPLEEDYVMEPPHYTMPAKTIPDNDYFVLGDNRNNSNDSHTGWTVPRENMIGEAWFVYWPPNKLRLVKHYSYPELTGEDEHGAIQVNLVGGIT